MKNLSFKSESEDINYDPSKRAEATLEHILDEATPDEIIERELSTAAVEEERSSRPVLKHESNRAMSRVLFITRDRSYLEPNSQAINTMLSLATLFAEIHVMVLLPLGGKETSERLADNVWTYRVRAQFWWWLPFVATQKAKAEFHFGGGFRPDLIVGLDPFESGLATLKIAKKFNRAAQIHVFEDFDSPEFLNKHDRNRWRRKLAHYVLDHAMSVRTNASTLTGALKKKFADIPDLKTLPKFHNFSALLNAEPSFNVHERYPDYVFTAITFGPLTASSHLHDVFTALHFVLQNPRIGLIVVGKGPAKQLFVEKTKLLGIQKNVVFLNEAEDLASYLKTTDVLVQTDISAEGEDIVLKAAAAGLPMVMYETDLRKDLFKDKESAGLCPAGEITELTKRFNDLLNSQALRVQYENGARTVVETRLIEDEATYYRAYRDSIELTLSVSTESEISEEPAARSVPEVDPSVTEAQKAQ